MARRFAQWADDADSERHGSGRRVRKSGSNPFALSILRNEKLYAGTPEGLFDILVRHEIERLGESNWGVPVEDLPYEMGSDLRANAANNIRADWVKQGIWDDDWGPRWPPNSKPMSNTWSWSHGKTPRPEPSGWWKHERVHSSRHNSATTEKHAASRPVHQFRYQVAKERQWMDRCIDAQPKFPEFQWDEEAVRRVVARWQDNHLWQSHWGSEPGRTWAHEAVEGHPEGDIQIVELESSSSDHDSRRQSPEPPGTTGPADDVRIFPTRDSPLTFSGVTGSAADGGRRKKAKSRTADPEHESNAAPAAAMPSVDHVQISFLRSRVRYAGTPKGLFERLVRREKGRLHTLVKAVGLEPDVPFDRTLNLTANAQNSIRADWIDQGIWDDDWGPAWPQDDRLRLDNYRQWPPSGVKGPEPSGSWKHERPMSPDDGKDSGDKFAASRPLHQFRYQVAKERRWMESGDYAFPDRRRLRDLDREAVRRITQNWKEDELWQSQWGSEPGRTWAHEAPEEPLRFVVQRSGLDSARGLGSRSATPEPSEDLQYNGPRIEEPPRVSRYTPARPFFAADRHYGPDDAAPSVVRPRSSSADADGPPFRANYVEEDYADIDHDSADRIPLTARYNLRPRQAPTSDVQPKKQKSTKAASTTVRRSPRAQKKTAEKAPSGRVAKPKPKPKTTRKPSEKKARPRKPRGKATTPTPTSATRHSRSTPKATSRKRRK